MVLGARREPVLGGVGRDGQVTGRQPGGPLGAMRGASAPFSADQFPARAFSLSAMRPGTAVVLLATSVAVAGCGGGSGPSEALGAAVFARNCSACHSLIGNESLHRQGGDLVGYRLRRQELLEFAREMPARRPLTSSQLEGVVDYVLAIQQRGRTR